MPDESEPTTPPPAIPIDLPTAVPVELPAITLPGPGLPSTSDADAQILTYANRPANYGIWHQGRRLVLTKMSPLPPRCVKCNASTDKRLKRRLAWHHPAFFLFLLLGFPGLLVLLIVAIVTRKKAVVHVGLCPTHRRRRRWIIASTWLMILASVSLLILSVKYQSLAYFALGTLLLLCGLFVYILFGQVVLPSRIDDHHVWLKGVCRKYRESFPAWPFA